METQPYVSAPRQSIQKAALVATLLLAACGGGNNSSNTGSHSPSPAASATASPTSQPSASPGSSPTSLPVSAPLGVLVGSQAASSYTISLVGVDGKVVASAEASTPPITSCGNVAAAPYPLPVAESNARAYFMDAQGVIHFLGPDGSTGKATTVPAPTASRRSTFAVSPDDQRIAVVVASYSTTSASTSLYVEDLNGGGRHLNLFSESGARSLWAVGWHGTNNLVLAVVPSCTQGGGPFCCGMAELHVVDPATATRRFTLGAWAKCPIAGPPSPAGVVCESSPSFSQGTYLNWTGGTIRTLALNGPSAAFVSPGGGMVAFADPTGTSFTIGAATIPNMAACTWIDETHVMSGGDAQHQPRVADVINGGIVAVAAAGDCGGRLPGGL
jgi:hypothetical protein